MEMQIGDARLGDGNEALFLGFLLEVARGQGFDDIVLEAVAEALANDGCGYVSGAKTGEARTFLVERESRRRFRA